MNTHELAWAAGFFDGEGHIRYKRGNRNVNTQRYTWKNIILEVSQKQRILLDRFQLAVGFGKVYGPYRNGAVGSNSERYSYRFVIAGFYDIQRVIGMLYPWMGEIKRAQADAAIMGWLKEPRLRVGRKPGSRLIPSCHPNRPYKAKLLCGACYIKNRRLSKAIKGTIYP